MDKNNFRINQITEPTIRLTKLEFLPNTWLTQNMFSDARVSVNIGILKSLKTLIPMKVILTL